MSNLLQDERNKQIQNAYLLMKNATPDAYEQARVNYYTLKEGQGWLQQEKERLAKQEIEPILKSYTTKYDFLKKELGTQTQISELINMLKAQEVGDESESRYLTNQLNLEKSKVGVARRLTEVGMPPVSSYSFTWLPMLLDLIIGVLIIFVLYQILFGGKIFRKVVSAVPNTL